MFWLQLWRWLFAVGALGSLVFFFAVPEVTKIGSKQVPFTEATRCQVVTSADSLAILVAQLEGAYGNNISRGTVLSDAAVCTFLKDVAPQYIRVLSEQPASRTVEVVVRDVPRDFGLRLGVLLGGLLATWFALLPVLAVKHVLESLECVPKTVETTRS